MYWYIIPYSRAKIKRFSLAISMNFCYNILIVKLNLHKSGRKFFFITLCVEERAQVLSRLNDDASITLTPSGERIVSVWKSQHAANPALTASNFVIMPDHIHLLLIVDYNQDPTFDVIDWIHQFSKATGPKPAPSPANPDSPLPQAGFGGARAVSETTLPQAGFGGARAPVPLPPWRWAPRFWLVLSFESRQLAAIRRYIKLNPARALWKARNPDRFLRHTNVRHHSLDPKRRWDALGNLTLFASPFLIPVRLTRKLTLEQHRETIDSIIEQTRQGAIPVSGFISPGEKEVLRRLKAEPRARFIKMLPYALPPRYDPSAEDSRELAAGRMLILSGFPETVQHDDSISRANCLIMNDLIFSMCARASSKEILP